MKESKLISAESVTEGHPDKLCDQIADAILDDMLRQDPHAHVAVEVCACVGQFVVFGEVRGEVYTDIPGIVRKSCARSWIQQFFGWLRCRFLRSNGFAN